jgi:hypothetical protein
MSKSHREKLGLISEQVREALSEEVNSMTLCNAVSRECRNGDT